MPPGSACLSCITTPDLLTTNRDAHSPSVLLFAAMGRALTAEKAIAIYRLRPEMKTPGRLRRGAMAHCKVQNPPQLPPPQPLPLCVSRGVKPGGVTERAVDACKKAGSSF